jgi:hypothetical protein
MFPLAKKVTSLSLCINVSVYTDVVRVLSSIMCGFNCNGVYLYSMTGTWAMISQQAIFIQREGDDGR